MLGMLVTSSILGFVYQIPLYIGLFYAQAAFYLLALIGLLFSGTSLARIPLLSVPLSVMVIMLSFLKGFFEFLTGERRATWQPAGSQANDS